MTRIVHTNNPGRQRSHLRRTIAEILRHFMFKREIDEESKDMSATLVYSLRGIAETVEATTSAWEKRNYFLKADRFRLDWEWALPAAEQLQTIISGSRWEELPRAIAALAPHFRDIRIAKLTRPPSTWKANYRLLLQEGQE